MKPVETYIAITPKDIEKMLADKNFLSVQGNNILFVYADYRDVDVLTFLTTIFTIIGKIVVEDDKHTYYIVSDKFGEEVTEPFTNYENVSGKMANDIQKISDFIASCFVNKYDI